MALTIIQHPSGNYDDRNADITMLVLHYTGMESAKAALQHMCCVESQVSAHYMIDEVGVIYQLVSEEKRAWHAGKSFWRNQQGLNHCSIGIEMVNRGHEFGYHPFPEEQMRSVITLCQEIVTRYNISTCNIVGHSDIAPSRKQDPGELFDWKRLAAAQIGYFPHVTATDAPIILEKPEVITALQQHLAQVGYQLSINGCLDQETCDAIIAFKRRYYPDSVAVTWDRYAQAMLDALICKEEEYA